ncbi:HU family DNA-binding protein [uncultured Bacteroides sp.]|uniref:HU family DNA-binding protein n=1 Tax=uncultured Bacteroides sp. TaxID=162156 RepID=UPI002AAB6282|nr:HU family DNA-binding protein [uncultured Bacteroides sp.]
MPLFYKSKKSTLASKDGKKKWYPILVKVGGMVSTQKIGELIAEKSSLTPGDVHNVVRNLMTVMREQLLNSRSIKLDGLGTFTIISQSRANGVEKEEDVNSAQITRLRVSFRPEYKRMPGKEGITRALYDGVEYARWGTSEKEETGDSGKTEDDKKDNGQSGNGEDPNA